MGGDEVAREEAVGDHDEVFAGEVGRELRQGLLGPCKESLFGLDRARWKLPFPVFQKPLYGLVHGHARIGAPVAFAEHGHGDDGEGEACGDDFGRLQGPGQVARNDVPHGECGAGEPFGRAADLFPAFRGERARQVALQDAPEVFFGLAVTDNVECHSNGGFVWGK